MRTSDIWIGNHTGQSTQSVVQSIQIGLQCLLWDGTIVGSSRANVEETNSRRQTVWMYFMLLFQQLLLVCSQKTFINCKQWSKWSDLSAKIRQVIKLYVVSCTQVCVRKKSTVTRLLCKLQTYANYLQNNDSQINWISSTSSKLLIFSMHLSWGFFL